MKKKIIFGFILLFIAIAGFFAYKFLSPAVSNKQNAYFYIKSGDDLAAVKEHLIAQKLITGKNFNLVAKILRFKNTKPGRYKLPDGMSLYKLVRLLRSGHQAEVKIVIIKERTKESFAGKFGNNKKYEVDFDSLQMIKYLNNNDSLKKFGVDSNLVLSIVMPNTYLQKWNSTPDKVFQQFYTAYQKFWSEERKIKANSLHLTPLQVITLASIVEEETNKKEDKFKIASTYLNRVRTGMKLQADPTVIFAMKGFGIKRVLKVHLQTDSPYNTYMYAGIPPGPICTPTAETIDAVLNAPKTDYLFFVASHKFDGTSVFTTNLADHLKYARLYQQELTRRMDSSSKAKKKLIP
jgi:UPF0755 protein